MQLSVCCHLFFGVTQIRLETRYVVGLRLKGLLILLALDNEVLCVQLDLGLEFGGSDALRRLERSDILLDLRFSVLIGLEFLLENLEGRFQVLHLDLILVQFFIQALNSIYELLLVGAFCRGDID